MRDSKERYQKTMQEATRERFRHRAGLPTTRERWPEAPVQQQDEVDEKGKVR